MSAVGNYNAGQDSKNYYSYLAGTARNNAALERATGESNVREIGAQEMQQVKGVNEQGRDVVGAQKVALASGGAGVGSKTAEQLVSDTMTKTNLDEMALRYNADVKMKNARLRAEGAAMNDESQAVGYKMAGRNAAKAGNLNAFSSLLSTAGNVAYMNRPAKV